MADCKCHELGASTIIGMGYHAEIFRTFKEVAKCGAPHWWLSASICMACAQTWLIASEERQNDVFILLRLDRAQEEALIRDGVWPPDLDRYERLLEIGREAGHRVTFAEPEKSSLMWTIEDLARERPGIEISKLAALLNLSVADAARLARIVVAKTGVSITFDVE